MKSKTITYSLEQIDDVAKQVLNLISNKIILFKSDMGSGKTTFIRALLKALQSNDEISSPTFSIVNEYSIKDDKVYHFDLYRLESLEEALNFGIEEYIFSEHWVFIEWPLLIEEILPIKFSEISIKSTNLQNQRKLVVNY